MTRYIYNANGNYQDDPMIPKASHGGTPTGAVAPATNISVPPSTTNVSSAPTSGTINATPSTANAETPTIPTSTSAAPPITPADAPVSSAPVTPTNGQPVDSGGVPVPQQPAPTPSTPTLTPIDAGQVYGTYGLEQGAANLISQAQRGEIHIADAQNEIYSQVYQRALAELQPQVDLGPANGGISGEQASAEAARQAGLAFAEVGQRYSANPTGDALAELQFPTAATPEDAFTDATSTGINDGGLDIGNIAPIDYTQIDPGEFSFSYKDFLPSDITAGPTYQFQKEEGLRELEQLMAARGYTGSGFEANENSRFLARLLGEETDRQTDLATNQANAANALAQNEIQNRYGVALQNADNELKRMVAQGELNLSSLTQQQYYQLQKALADNAFAQHLSDTISTLQIDAADRDERAVNRDFDNIMEIIQTGLSQLPISYALQGTDSAAGATEDGGELVAQLIQAMAAATGAGGGGGGGSAGSAVPAPPGPSGPDYSNITPLQIQSDLASGANWANAFQNIFNGLF